MRQLKFRAFNEHTKEMFQMKTLWLDIKYSSEYKIMQFTGLQDKNGVDIYEGDIVQHDAWDYPFEVVFNNEKARFVCKLKTGLTHYIHGEGMVVVGNVYQNPELTHPSSKRG